MKIVHLIPSMSGGGAESQLSYLAPELVKLGHEVHLIYLHEGPQLPFLKDVKLHRINVDSNYNPSTFFKIIGLLRSIEPDVIQTWIFQMDILGGMASKILRIPWVLREPTSLYHYTANWKNKFRKLLGAKADYIVSNSRGGDDYWADKVDRKRRSIIRNGLPLESIEDANAALPIEDRINPVLLFVGRLASDGTANKNLKYLIEAVARVNQEVRVSLLLCGDGPQRQELEQRIVELKMKNVCFTGFVEKSTIWGFMKRSAIFVSLSSYEGCPNSVLEAMACGCRLILSNIPAHREILDNETAIFVDYKDAHQISNAIKRSLSTEKFPIAGVLKEKASSYSIHKMALEYEAIYNKIVRN